MKMLRGGDVESKTKICGKLLLLCVERRCGWNEKMVVGVAANRWRGIWSIGFSHCVEESDRNMTEQAANLRPYISKLNSGHSNKIYF